MNAKSTMNWSTSKNEEANYSINDGVETYYAINTDCDTLGEIAADFLAGYDGKGEIVMRLTDLESGEETYFRGAPNTTPTVCSKSDFRTE